MLQSRLVSGVRLVTCSRCFGRGYQPEYRANGGFYARTCPGCGGSGEREPTRRDLANERRKNEELDRRAVVADTSTDEPCPDGDCPMCRESDVGTVPS